MKEVTAHLKNARISPQKCRLVANQIRALSINKALNLLTFSPKKAAKLIKEVLDSAISNAEHNDGMDIDELDISSIYINEAPRTKHFRARAKGRGAKILKRNCHITVNVMQRS